MGVFASVASVSLDRVNANQPVRGLGAAIDRATDSGNLPVLLAATMVMSVVVVTVNRTLLQ